MKSKLFKVVSMSLVLSMLFCTNMYLAFAQNLSEPSSGSSDEAVMIDDEHFPDAIFRDYVSSTFDKDTDGSLSKEEIESVTYIFVNGKGIRSLQGIEYFVNLQSLYAEVNRIQTLDVSKNVDLITLNVNNNELKSILLPNQEENNTLVYLDVFANQLTSLDVSNLHALTFLHADDNQLTHLDLSENPLTQSHGFVAMNNYLESITLPNNNVEYPWTTFLQTQLFPRDKSVGYKVVWYTNPEKTDVLDPVATPTIRCTGQTLYAQYVPITYTVEFQSGGGTGTMEKQTFQYGTAQNLNANQFEKEHYVFGGWKSTNGRTFDDQQSVQNLTDTDGATIILTATWKEKDYTGEPYNIILHSNNGSDTTQEVAAEFGVNKTLPKNTFTKDHYDFKGWSSFPSNHNVIYVDEDVVKVNHPEVIGGNTLNLYAVWDIQKYTVEFINGNETITQTIEYGSTVQLPEATNKVGYTFTGWYTESGQQWQEETIVDQNTKLYAKYEPVTYSIEFDGNGADNGNAMDSSKLDVKYNEQATLPENLFTKKYHTFKGWSTTPNGEVAFIDQANVYELAFNQGDVVRLYAVWERNQVEVTVKDGTSSQVMTLPQGDKLTLETPSKVGYIFTGWQVNETDDFWNMEDAVESSMTLTATYSPIQYTVTFDGNGADNLTAMDGDIMQMQYDQAQTIPKNKFTKQYYTFVGWSTEKNGETIYHDGASINNLVNTNGTEVKLYAVWKQNTVDITVNDGVNPQYTITVGQGDVLPDSITVPRTGYTFEGWYTDASFAEDTKWNSQAPLVAPVTLYAKWSINEYTIQFSNTEFTPITFTVEDSVVLNTPYKQGYDFVEWRDENNQVIPPTIENTARNMTLTAVWKKIDDLNPVISGSDTQNVLVGMTAQDKTKAEQVVQSAIDTIGTYPGNPAELVQKIKDEIALGNVLSGQIAITALNEQSVSPADMVLIHDMLNQLNDSNYQFTIGHLMDISILVRSNSTVVGSLSALPEPVKFSIAVPEQMQNSGRVFKVLRLHDNHISVIDSEYSNGIVAFETDEFSTYALVYGDMKAENQMNTDSNHAQNSGSNEMQHNVQTGDNTYLSITLLSVLLAFSLTLVIVLVSKKKHKKDE